VGARNYLRDCVQGYLIFLEVYFTIKARSLFSRLLAWFADQTVHRAAWFDADFIRARIDRMLVDFWYDVRVATLRSSTYTQFSFAVEGDVWKLFAAYESEMLTRLGMDVWPHPRFFNPVEGEFKEISANPPATSQLAHAKNSGSTIHPSSATSTLTRFKLIICPFHLFHALDMKRHTGAPYDPCSHGTSCVHGHVDTQSVTRDEATTAMLASGLHASLVDKVITAIQANASRFKP
jgi:hypothetical protein